jgi:phosphoglycolate phosphatase-like HAD superfamily hydrolase
VTSPAFLFDLDGTLVDSVYQHVLAWREALEASGIELAVWRIHRRIGMSGGLFVNALLREIGRQVSREQVERMQVLHMQAFLRQASQVRPLPGATDLLAALSGQGVPWAIATSGRRDGAQPALDLLGLGPDTVVVTPGAGPGGWVALRRLWRRRAPACGRIPRVRRPCRSLAPPR